MLDGALEPMLRTTRIELIDGLEARSLNGKGRLHASTGDIARYDNVFAHCDVLVVGGGPAGLEAALTAGPTGAWVLLFDEQSELGGSLLGAPTIVGG
jgi:sarcosine oxidase, subunit alpha